MSYKKAMKHACNPRKNKLTATKLRGNRLVFCSDPFAKDVQRLTPLAPDSSKAAVMSLPEFVKDENTLPAEGG